ncbi:S8 family serine peptidase [Planomicrobium sp. MB-3u-38]|uniref:S8 family serine peptidase n=1 Tax=Planomicrobium sp. MB-3u-38 TaxID=2058318 RepID=UPI000C7CDEC1|nr:S8 family serine peptidase [Planomicrobium sp. MB-3u-38]PKH10551.1 peptidase S8 [Planomicrobium sp. MB-3u-38]
MSKTNFTKFFSAILTLVLAFSLLSPFSASAEQNLSFKESRQTQSEMEIKAAIADQLRVLEGKPQLHDALKNVTGEQEVDVIIHLSEKPVGLERAIVKSKGKAFSNANANSVKKNVKAQQATAKKEMKALKLLVKEGYSYQTVLNGFAATVKAKDLDKLLKIKGVTLVEPDVEVHAFETGETAEDGEVGAAMDNSIDFLGIEPLWQEGFEGQGVKVAVLDTGIDADHPEFAGIYKGGKNFIPNSATYTKPRADDDASETLPSERPAGTPEFNANGSSFYTSHGTHVAGTIAAIGANEYGIKGIAPKVDLYAYRVLGAYGSGSTSGIVAAIEESVIQDMDVINLSLGGGANTEIDAGSFAINNAMLSGTISVLATGNSGPNRGTMGTPATARLGIAVGNTTNPEKMYDGAVSITAGDYNLAKSMDLMGTTFGQDLATQLSGELEVVAVPGFGTPADFEKVDVTGKVALISRGSIAFVDKIAAAKEAGAIAALIHNNAGGTGSPGPSGTFLGDAFEFLPTFDMSQTDGEALRAALAADAGTISFGGFTSETTKGDEVNSSSSRGPSTPNFDIKPDVSAPGTNIMSTIPMYKTDFPDATYDQAYTRKTGTSMATPHIAGIAALVKQAHPEWNAFDVKVALSNTAEILDTEKYDVFSQGAGRVNAYAAVHPEALAYAQDKAVLDNSGALVDNIKGTVTFGPQSIRESGVSVNKEILVKDIAGGGGNYDVTVEVTKAFAGAAVTVDQSSFDLNGEQLLNVNLTAAQNANVKPGDEILGYIHITNGDYEMSLPFAADFGEAATAEVKNMSITETDLSFDGDGVQDIAQLAFTITGDVGTNYIELWDIMNPEGGEFGDGYIGYVHFASSLKAGSYTLNVAGQYQPWGGAPATTIPDGLYTIDLTASTPKGNIGDYVGPVVVKTTAPEIAGTVENGQATGQITDKYIEYNKELALYGLEYNLNEKLKATYTVTENGEVSAPVKFDLAQDGSFAFPVTPATTKVTVAVADAAGNSAEALIYEREEAEPVVTLSADPAQLALTVGDSEQVTVTQTTTPEFGDPATEDVTADAVYTVADPAVASVENGLVTANAAGTTAITISYGGNETTVTVTVTAPEPEPEDNTTLSVNKEELTINGKKGKVVVWQETVLPNGKTKKSNVTKDAVYTVADASILSVTDGLITAKKSGKTTITISYEGDEVTVEVTVR